MGRRRIVWFLIALLIIFTIIFFLAFYGLQRKEAYFNIGIPAEFEDWLIMILCIGSIIKIVWDLYVLKSKE